MNSQPAAATLSLNSPIGRGPIMRAYRKRAFYIWLGLALLGLLPSLLGAALPLQAAGLGLWLPGGGFLLSGSPLLLLLTLVLFVVALAAWLLMGGFIFPLLVWGGAAALAALDTGTDVWSWARFATPLLALGVVALALLKERNSDRAAVPKAAAVQQLLRSTPYREPVATAAVGEALSDTDLGALRYTLDLALQPIDEFTGFVTIDQFREAAWRYQLVGINHALGILQTSRIPAFRGYLHEAQRRAIVKMQDKRVWQYWRIENFVGNLRFGRDPVRKDNIMYHGWWGLALGAYERATGDRQFSRPGALTLVENDHTRYVYDYPALVRVMEENFKADKLCHFPCEPNWVFQLCNLYGMSGMVVYDRINGTRHGLDLLDNFNHILEQEFTLADGRAAIIGSMRSGFLATMDQPLAFSANAQMLNMTSPRLAQVYWQLCMRSLEETYKGDREQWGEYMIDAGNYRKNNATFWVGLMRGAREMGDMNIYNYARERYDALGIDNRNGVMHWEGSVLQQLAAHMARFGTAGAWNRMAFGEVPAAISSGPVLDDAPYPHVLVAGANNDGARLDLVLCAGTEPALRELRLARLNPQGKYRIDSTDSESNGQIFSADDQGNSRIIVPVGKRSHLSIVPHD